MENTVVDISRVSVREISKSVASDFIKKYHYTKKASSTRYALGIFYREETEHMFFAGENEQLIGCMTYGHPVRKVLVSYADPEQSHTGGIYRATNWIYQGCGYSKLMPDFSLLLEEGGLWIHSRTVGAKFGNKSVENLAKRIGRTFWRKEETAKHRYIYFLCDKKEKKRMMKNLKIPVIPYNDIKEYVQLIQKVTVTDGVVENIEVIQGVDNGWKPQKVELKENV